MKISLKKTLPRKILPNNQGHLMQSNARREKNKNGNFEKYNLQNIAQNGQIP